MDGQQYTQEAEQSKDYVYKDEYVTFNVEFTNYGNFFHCFVLKKDKDTRTHIKRVWIQLQEHLVARGETELFAMIEPDDTTLKDFASSYNFTQCDTKEDSCGNEYEIWKVELR